MGEKHHIFGAELPGGNAVTSITDRFAWGGHFCLELSRMGDEIPERATICVPISQGSHLLSRCCPDHHFPIFLPEPLLPARREGPQGSQ